MSASDLAKVENITKAVESKHYKFIPRTANPVGYTSVNLDPSYYLKVQNDTLTVNLPYFGRSYSAPIDAARISYDFTSTKYDYDASAKKDGWEIAIKLLDTSNRGLQLYLSVGNTGYANLRIQDANRQGISYYGTIEEK